MIQICTQACHHQLSQEVKLLHLQMQVPNRGHHPGVLQTFCLGSLDICTAISRRLLSSACRSLQCSERVQQCFGDQPFFISPPPDVLSHPHFPPGADPIMPRLGLDGLSSKRLPALLKGDCSFALACCCLLAWGPCVHTRKH